MPRGAGRVVVGNEVQEVAKGDVVATLSGTAHYALPDKAQGPVLVVVNTLPFNLANNIDVAESDPSHNYDNALFKQLTGS